MSTASQKGLFCPCAHDGFFSGMVQLLSELWLSYRNKIYLEQSFISEEYCWREHMIRKLVREKLALDRTKTALEIVGKERVASSSKGKSFCERICNCAQIGRLFFFWTKKVASLYSSIGRHNQSKEWHLFYWKGGVPRNGSKNGRSCYLNISFFSYFTFWLLKLVGWLVGFYCISTIVDYLDKFILIYKIVLLLTIRFIISTQFISIWSIDRTLSGATIPR